MDRQLVICLHRPHCVRNARIVVTDILAARVRKPLDQHGFVWELNVCVWEPNTQYVGDHVWNIESQKKLRLASLNPFRGTVDLNLDILAGWHGATFHATAVWQAGGNLGQYLGLLANPSSLVSANPFSLNSWWIEKRFRNGGLEIRAG